MLHFDKHFTASVRDAGARWLPLWQFFASYAMWLFIGVAVVLIALQRTKWSTIVIPVIATQVVTLALQAIIHRDRPPLSVAAIVMWKRTPSFPSVHAAVSITFALVLSSVMLPYGAIGIAGAVLAFFWAACIALSRVMVGVHFLGDIIVGAILGAVLTALWSGL
jgi:undecaprenyl-diphosphatase